MLDIAQKKTTNIIAITLLGAIVAIITVVADNITIFNINIGYLLVVIACLLCFFVIASIHSGILKTICLFLFLTLSFDIEYPLITIGEFGFDLSHPNGLRAAIVINHFYLIILLWLIVAVLNKKLSIKNMVSNSEFKIGCLFLLSGIISVFFAVDKLASMYAIIRLVFLLILFLLIINSRVSQMWRVLKLGIIFTVLFQFVVGVAQYITGKPIGLRVLGESSEPFRATNIVSQSEQGISGTMGHPGVLAMFLILVFPFLFLNFFWSKKEHGNLTSSVFYILPLVLLVLLSQARTSIVLMIVAIFLMFIGGAYIKKRFGKSLNTILTLSVLFSLISVMFFIMFFNKLYERFAGSDFVYQIIYRLHLAQIGIDLSFSSPRNFFFGVGLNNYTDVLSKYGNSFAYTNPVHDFYLLLLAEGGVFHFFTYILICVLALTKLKRIIKNGTEEQSYQALALTTSLICLFLYNLTGWSAYKNQPFVFFFIMIAFSSLLYKEYLKTRHKRGGVVSE